MFDVIVWIISVCNTLLVSRMCNISHVSEMFEDPYYHTIKTSMHVDVN